MQAIFLVRVALLAVAMLCCADVALAQRTSTFEEKLEYNFDSARGDDLNPARAATPQQCRDMCLAIKQCRYWYWIQPDAGGTDPKIHSNCVLLKAITNASRGRDFGYRYYGGAISDGPSTAGPSPSTPGQTPAPVPTATAQQPFPLPLQGMELIFRVPAPNDPNIGRYASFQFVSYRGERTLVRRNAWEGPLNSPSTSGEQYVDYIFDESPGDAGSSSCTVSASDAALRQIYVGAKLTYSRTCTTTHNNGSGSRSVANVERVVLRAERVTVPLGTFDALVVRKTTRGVYRSISRSGQETMVETTESENTKWWVPALGFFVKDEWRSRTVNRVFSQQLIEEYRRENEPLPPTSTDWYSNPAMIAIVKR